ncbi:uncharacterized protein LDX57_011485 [Aspergillus melleus]|uniref:uncharacterized protein n=1 Tax=Aspergillus melleus TaxID=138277 RepID=UPI001E8D318F|nr:uncharacterized protein LDX57_011485 [Aspergillus melleus]KAH8433848.1 hypothetical protein LDX57_011485 [Aspergillus melleus]
MHPRLFHSLVFLEPMIQVESPGKPGGQSPALWASSRPDLWSSPQDAEKYVRKSPFWRRWDPRSVDRYVRFGLRSVPTALYPNHDPGTVTLATTKAQEAWTYLRLNAAPRDNSGNSNVERFLTADLAATPRDGQNNSPEYVNVCPWTCIAFEYLSYVRPSVLYVFGEKSHINIPERRRDKLERTGKGLGGSGGVAAGRVKAEILPGGSHMAPFEKIHETADAISSWISSQNELYQTEKEFWERQHDSGKSERNSMALSSQWMKYVTQPVDIKRERKSNL